MSENSLKSEKKKKKKRSSGNFKERKTDVESTLIKHTEGQKWYSYQVNKLSQGPQNLDDQAVRTLFQEAEQLYNQEVVNYVKEAQKSGGSEASWLFQVLKKGTAQDKMSAIQLQTHTSPIHALQYIQFMIESVEEKKIRDAMQYIPILEDVFLNVYLPPERKLVTFSSRPLSSLKEHPKDDQKRKKSLTLWVFEHQLKLIYEKFIRALGNCAGGNVEDLNKKSLKTILNLLAERPEGEQILLTMLVNKLGHPNYKIGSFTENLIEELARRQPAMRSVIVKEIERLIYRKNISQLAILYAATALSQFALRREESDLAAQLLSIYFGLFKTIVSNGKIDPKLLNILLTAANRAFPYAAEKAESLIDDIDALYRLVHTGTYAISLHTLRLLFQFHQVSESLSDRFFTALYRKLLDPIPPSAYNQLLLLVYKAMKMDSSSDRVRTFVKRLLQIATTATPSLATGILILISKTMEARKDKSLIILRREPERNPVLLNSNDDEEEKYFDVDSDSEVTTPNSKSNVKKEEMDPDEDVKSHKKSTPNSSVGWVHRSAKGKMRDPYDPSARNPLFVSCSEIADNELYLLSKHFHPSVAAFANSLIERGVINYKGDPLTDFSLMHFLDRFAFRNPKSKNKPKVEKVIKKKAYDPWGVRGMSIKSAEYLNKQDSELPADERFLHRYAKSNIRLPEKKDKEDDDEWETRSVDSEEFETLLEKFEAGEKNDEFFDDTDFGEAFSAEKKKKVEKRKPEDDVDADELDLEGTDDDDLEDEQEGDMDDDDSEEESDVEMESDISDDDGGFRRQTTKGGDDSDDDWDMDSEGEVDDDANMAGEMFANLLDEEQEEKSEKKKKNRGYKNKSKSKGKR